MWLFVITGVEAFTLCVAAVSLYLLLSFGIVFVMVDVDVDVGLFVLCFW